MKKLFTSESVTEGHPDKVCDQISDAILDAIFEKDPYGRVAAETTTTTGYAMVMGEISTKCYVDIPKLVRKVILEIGYDRSAYGFDGNTCAVLSAIDEQSGDIAMGVDKSLEYKDGSLNDDFEDLGEHISATERRADAAERDAEERYLSAYLADRIGERFKATVNGVSRFGLFVVIDDVRAEGLVPVSTLPGDYYVYEEDKHRLFGSSTGKTYELGERVDVILAEAQPVTGGLLFHLLDAGIKKPSKQNVKKYKNPKKHKGAPKNFKGKHKKRK